MLKFKKSYLLILLVIGVGIISISLYQTLAYNSKVEASDNNYNISLAGSNEVVTLGGNEGKSILYRIVNTNKGKVSYGVGYSVGDVSVRVYSNYYEDVKGVFDYGESKYVKLYLKNNSANQSTVTLKTILGYENGGDLIVPNGYALVTDRYASVGNGKYFNGTSDYIDVRYAGENFGKSISIGARFKPDGYNKSAVSYVVTNVESGGIGLVVLVNGHICANILTDTMSDYKTICGTDVVNDEYYTAVVTYDGNSLKLYVDGKKLISASVTGNIKVTTVPFYVGANPNTIVGTSEYFKGQISDVFVTKEILDEETIAKNFTDTFIYDENDSTYFYYHLS